MSAKDDWVLALNLLGKVGIEGDLIGEFGKAKAMLHSMEAQGKVENNTSLISQIPNQVDVNNTTSNI